MVDASTLQPEYGDPYGSLSVPPLGVQQNPAVTTEQVPTSNHWVWTNNLPAGTENSLREDDAWSPEFAEDRGELFTVPRNGYVGPRNLTSRWDATDPTALKIAYFGGNDPVGGDYGVNWAPGNQYRAINNKDGSVVGTANDFQSFIDLGNLSRKASGEVPLEEAADFTLQQALAGDNPNWSEALHYYHEPFAEDGFFTILANVLGPPLAAAIVLPALAGALGAGAGAAGAGAGGAGAGAAGAGAGAAGAGGLGTAGALGAAGLGAAEAAPLITVVGGTGGLGLGGAAALGAGALGAGALTSGALGGGAGSTASSAGLGGEASVPGASAIDPLTGELVLSGAPTAAPTFGGGLLGAAGASSLAAIPSLTEAQVAQGAQMATDAQGAEPITVTGAPPAADLGSVIAGGGAALGLGGLTAGGAAPTAAVGEEPITVTGNPPLSGALDPVIAPGAVAAGGLGSALTTSGVVDPNEIVVQGAGQTGVNAGSIVGGLGAAGAGAAAAGAGSAAAAAPKTTLQKITDALTAAGLSSQLIGSLLGGGGSSLGNFSGSLGNGNLSSTFHQTLPTTGNRIGGGSDLSARVMPQQDWTKYASRPGQSFFNYVPQTYTPPLPGQTDQWTHLAVGGRASQPTRKGFAVNGAGSGRSDHVPAMLSDGEYVMDAETVAMLGDGSNKAGADKLDQFRVNLRKHKGKQMAKGKFSLSAKAPEAYMAGVK